MSTVGDSILNPTVRFVTFDCWDNTAYWHTHTHSIQDWKYGISWIHL